MRRFLLMLIVCPPLAFSALAQENLPKAATVPTAQELAPTSLNDRKINTNGALTQSQAEAWVGKVVFSSDGKKIGKVVAFVRGDDHFISEMHADIGGFLGFGQTRVKLTPAQIELRGDRVIIAMTSARAWDLPKI